MQVPEKARHGSLSEMVGGSEERFRVCSRQRNRENYPAESAAQYWKRTVAIPFLDVICSELKSRCSKENRAHCELCALIPQVITSMSEEATAELAQVLHEKWGHLMPLPSSFDSELFRWINHWKQQEASDYESISVYKCEETSKKFSPSCLWGARGRKGHFLVFGGSIILGFATQ